MAANVQSSETFIGERLGAPYRQIPGWETVRPPGAGYLVMARVNDVSPDFDPNRVSRPIIIDPGTEYERMFDPTTGAVIPRGRAAHAMAAAGKVVGPSLFNKVEQKPPQPSVQPVAAPQSGQVSRTLPKRKVEMEMEGTPFKTMASFHEIIEIQTDNRVSHIAFVWDLSDDSTRTAILRVPDGRLAVALDGDKRIFLCSLDNPVVFTFRGFELCILEVLKEVNYGDD